MGHKTSPRRRGTLIEWSVHYAYSSRITRGSKQLVLVIQATPKGRWVALALESVIARGTLTQQLNTTLDAHAHHVVGADYRTELAAKRGAEAYARRWQPGAATDCACDEISAGRRLRRRRTGPRGSRARATSAAQAA